MRKRIVKPEEALTPLVRDAFIDAYIQCRFDFKEEEWKAFAPRVKAFYQAMAVSLVKRGVRVEGQS